MDREEQIKVMMEAEKRANEQFRQRRAQPSYRAFVERFDARAEREREQERIAL